MADGTIYIDTKLDKSSLKPQIKSMSADIKAGFAAVRDIMQGPIAAVGMLKQAIGTVVSVVNTLENEFAESEKTIALLNATLRATGAIAWTSSKQVEAMIDEFKNLTGVDDDVIRGMETVLLGFKNIKGDNFKEASLQIMNMATVMKMDFSSAAVMVGKALDNPIEGISSLSKQGFKFSEEQKKVMQSMIDTGNIAEAQKIILNELESTYGGNAAAAGATSAALKNKLGMAFGDINKEIGRVITETLTPLRETLFAIINPIVKWVQEGDNLKNALKGIAIALAVLMGPLTWIVLAITLVVQNWDWLVSVMEIGVIKLGAFFKIFGSQIKEVFLVAFNAIKLGALTLGKIIIDVVLGSVAKLLEVMGKLPFVGEKFAEASRAVSGFKSKIDEAITTAKKGSVEAITLAKAEQDAYEKKMKAEEAAAEARAKELAAKRKNRKEEEQKTKDALEAAQAEAARAQAAADAAEEDAKRIREKIRLRKEEEERMKSIARSIAAYGKEQSKKFKKEAEEKRKAQIDLIGETISAITSALAVVAGSASETVSALGTLATGIAGVISNPGDVKAWAQAFQGVFEFAKSAGVAGLDRVTSSIESLVNMIVQLLAPVISMILDVVSGVIETLNILIEPIVALLAPLFEALKPIISVVMLIIKIVGMFVGDVLVALVGALASILIPVFQSIGALFLWFYNKVLVPVNNWMAVGFAKIYNGFADFINSMIDGINEALKYIGKSITYRVQRKDEAAGQLQEITATSPTTTESANAVKDANEALAENKKLFKDASKAADAYNKVLTKVVDTAAGFYEGLQNIGNDISQILIDSISAGFDNDDLLFALEEYIKKAVIQAAVFTDSFMAQVSQIGAALASAIASGDYSQIQAIKNQLSALAAQAASTADVATQAISSAFGSYAVGTLSVQGDQFAAIHNGEMILPSGISQEARAAGIYIGPIGSGMSSLSGVTINLTASTEVDGVTLARSVFKYQDVVVGEAYGG